MLGEGESGVSGSPKGSAGRESSGGIFGIGLLVGSTTPASWSAAMLGADAEPRMIPGTEMLRRKLALTKPKARPTWTPDTITAARPKETAVSRTSRARSDLAPAVPRRRLRITVGDIPNWTVA